MTDFGLTVSSISSLSERKTELEIEDGSSVKLTSVSFGPRALSNKRFPGDNPILTSQVIDGQILVHSVLHSSSFSSPLNLVPDLAQLILLLLLAFFTTHSQPPLLFLSLDIEWIMIGSDRNFVLIPLQILPRLSLRVT
jgi:hypothetical protein